MGKLFKVNLIFLITGVLIVIEDTFKQERENCADTYFE
jgi:hypothetical protein